MRTSTSLLIIALLQVLAAIHPLCAAVGVGDSDEFTVNTLARFTDVEGEEFPVNTFIGFGWGDSPAFGVNTGWEIDQPELLIASDDDIQFQPQEDGSYRIAVRVSNHGLPARNVAVRCFADNQRIGEVTIDALAQNGSAWAYLPWRPANPNYLVRVVVDPDNRIAEYIEGNNVRSKRFGAGGGDGSRPVIAGVEARFDGLEAEDQVGYFISGVEGAINRFRILFDAPDQIDHFDYTINGDHGRVTDPDGDGEWALEYDMGLIGFEGGNLVVTAYNHAGFASEAYAVEIAMLALPDWYVELVGEQLGAQAIEFNDGFYEILFNLNPEEEEEEDAFAFAFEFEEEDENGDEIVFIGGTGVELTPSMDIGLGYNIFEGAADFRFRGEWDEIKLFDGPFEVGANGGFDVDGSLYDDLRFRQASGMIRLHIGMEFPTIRTVYPLCPGLQAALEFTARLWGDLLGQLTFGVGESDGLEFIAPTNFSAQINAAVTVTGKIELALGVAGADLAGTPTIYARILVEYTTADGRSFEYAFGVQMPWEVYVYYGFGGREWGRYLFAEGTLGPWEWPNDARLLPPRDNLNVNWPSVMADPSLAVDANGAAVLVWIGDVNDDPSDPQPRLLFSFYDPENDEWSEPAPIHERDGGVSDPKVKFDSNGAPVVAWTHKPIEIDGNPTLAQVLASQEVYACAWSGDSWSEPQALTDNEFGDGLPALALSGDGQGLIAWTAANDTALATRDDWEIKYSVRNDGEWSEPQNLTDDDNADCSVDLAFSGAGGAMAVWLSDEDADFITDEDTYVKFALWDGEGWSDADNIPAGDGPKHNPSVTYLSGGDACACWVQTLVIADTSRWQVAISRYDSNRGVWSQPEIAYQSIQKIDEPFIQAATVDDDDFVQLVWRGFGSSAVEDYFTTFKNVSGGGAWTEVTPLTEDDFTDWMGAAAVDANRNTYFISVKSDVQSQDEQFRAQFNVPGGRNVQGAANLSSRHRLFSGLNFNAFGVNRDLGLNDELNFGIQRIEPDLTASNEAIIFTMGEETTVFGRAGEPVTITAEITNQGVVTSEETRIDFWRGHPAEEGSELLGQVNTGAIEPDHSEVVSLEWEAVAGVHDIYVSIDPEEAATDRNRRNNLRHATLNVIPNLNLQSLTVSSDNPLADEEVELTATVTNSGGAAATAFTVGFWRGNPGAEDSELIGDAEVDGLERDAATPVRIQYSAIEGLQDLWAVVNPEFDLAEEDSTDNRGSLQLKVLPDLSVLAADVAAEAPDDRVVSRLTAVIHNLGGASAEDALIRFFDGNPLTGGGLIAEREINVLPARDAVAVAVDWADVEEGAHTVYVIVDPENAIAERSENNNRAYREFYLEFQPDLTFGDDAVALRPLSPVVGQEFAVSGRFVNAGGAPAGFVSLQVYLDYPDSTLLMGYESVREEIQPNSEVEFEFTLNAEEMAAGIHTLYFILDKNETVAERDEDNNRASVQFFVLGQPLRLRVSVAGGDLRLDWEAVEDAEGYRVYRSERPYFEPSEENLLETVAEPGYTDEGAANSDSKYFYKVEAFHEGE